MHRLNPRYEAITLPNDDLPVPGSPYNNIPVLYGSPLSR